jgi:quercetin dioxygenase-like cupin family protein
MALPHATTGKLIDLAPLGEKISTAVSTALIKTPHLEVMRLILHAGKTMSEYKVAGEVTVLCIEGQVELSLHGRTQSLRAGHWVYLVEGEPHALHAVEDSALLVTILLNQS